MPSTMFKCPVMQKCSDTDYYCYTCPTKELAPKGYDCFCVCFYQGKVCETCEHLEREE